jgi:hypothetical protein
MCEKRDGRTDITKLTGAFRYASAPNNEPGAHPEFFIGGGGGEGLTLKLHIIFDSKNCFKNHATSITQRRLQPHLYTYEYNYMFHDSIIVSYLLLVFFQFY